MTRYVIAKAVEHGWCDETRTFTFEPVLALPDAEHIHVTRHPDGTFTAVPMRRARAGEIGAAFIVPAGVTAQRGLWLDAPGEDA